MWRRLLTFLVNTFYKYGLVSEIYGQILVILQNQFVPAKITNKMMLITDQFSYLIPSWKHQKTKYFLVFLGGAKWQHWSEIS